MVPVGEIAFADEFLFAGVQAFVAFSVVLAREGLATYRAYERSFVGVRAEMGAEVVGSREALWTECALESGRVLLYAFRVAGGGARPLGIG